MHFLCYLSPNINFNSKIISLTLWPLKQFLIKPSSALFPSQLLWFCVPVYNGMYLVVHFLWFFEIYII